MPTSPSHAVSQHPNTTGNPSITLTALMLLLSCTLSAIGATEIQHRFLAADESRQQIHYINQFDPAADWTIEFAGNRDLQLINSEHFLASFPGGYRSLSMADGAIIKEVTVDGLKVTSALRLDNGHTIIGSGTVIVELDAMDQEVCRVSVPSQVFRLLRLTPAGHLIFGQDKRSMTVMAWNGDILHTLDLSAHAHIKYPYVAVHNDANHTFVATGYGGSVVEVDEQWAYVRTLDGQSGNPPIAMHFTGQLQVLPNGNIIACNWTGHGAQDSVGKTQLLEWNAQGDVVWQWSDSDRAGSIHGVAVIE